jgi:hypothetical protein
VNAESDISRCRVAAGKNSRIHQLGHATSLGINVDGALTTLLFIVVKDEVAFIETV